MSNLHSQNSKIVQEIPESDQLVPKKMNEIIHPESKPSTTNKSTRPKSSRDHRSFDPCKVGSKATHSINQKKSSLATGTKTNTNFGKKKSSNDQADPNRSDQLLAKYKKIHNKSKGMVSSVSSNNIEQVQNSLITSIQNKNSRNCEKLGDKGVAENNSKLETKDSNGFNLASSENIQSNNLAQNMSVDYLEKQRQLRQK